MLKVFSVITLVCAVLAPAIVSADYSEHEKSEWVYEQLISKHDFTREQVAKVLSNASVEPRILDSMRGAAEKTKTWTAYRTSFLSDYRISKGVEFVKKNQAALQKAEDAYGVPKSLLAAIAGVETNYGGYTGKANVLNALATLAFDHPRRGKFFRSELVEFIVLSREKSWKENEVLGSYAGAMGIAQFMPSNYRRLAVDGNQDGEIDLLVVEDAVMSIANYLSHHGWQKGKPITALAAVRDDADYTKVSGKLKPRDTVAELWEAGFASTETYDSDDLATLVRFKDSDGDETWVALNNFYVISRYNPRAKYAMAVFLLQQAIEQGVAIDASKSKA